MSANSHQKKLKTLVIIPQRKLPEIKSKNKKASEVKPQSKENFKIQTASKKFYNLKTQEIESQNNNPAKTKLP